MGWACQSCRVISGSFNACHPPRRREKGCGVPSPAAPALPNPRLGSSALIGGVSDVDDDSWSEPDLDAARTRMGLATQQGAGHGYQHAAKDSSETDLDKRKALLFSRDMRGL